MSLLQCSFYSNVLDMECAMNIFAPIGLKAQNASERHYDIPVLYLLHGFTEDHTAWIRRTALERYLLDKNLVVVMPNVHRSFYTDTASGRNYFEFLSHELPALIADMLPISTKREDTFAAGLSMGGYGALKLALTYPDRFIGAASLSGAVNIHMVFEDRQHMPEVKAVFGDQLRPENDLYYLFDQCAAQNNIPYLYQCCGTEDFLYEENKRFRRYIEKKAPHYVYRESAGAHTWDFWEEYIRYVLQWMMEINPKIRKN